MDEKSMPVSSEIRVIGSLEVVSLKSGSVSDDKDEPESVEKSVGTPVTIIGPLAVHMPSGGGVSCPGSLLMFHTMVPCPKEVAQAKTMAAMMNNHFITFFIIVNFKSLTTFF